MGTLRDQPKQRYIRKLPGRARIEVFGLKYNSECAKQTTEMLNQYEGIQRVSPCIDTGRLLLLYDEEKISFKMIIGKLEFIENCVSNDLFCRESSITEQVYKEVAATTLEGQTLASSMINDNPLVFTKPIQSNVGTLQINQSDTNKTHLPVPLALSVGGLCVLGVKQLFWGRSALARSSTAFNLAALVAVTSGYALFKSDPTKEKNKWVNPEFVIGASALALALVRENMVVLAGLSILQYVKWKRDSLQLSTSNRPAIPSEIRSYSQKTSKVTTILAGATWAVTGSPLTGMAVMLAGNPRVATLPAQYAWDQADFTARKNGYMMPENSSLEELAATQCIAIEDTSLIFREQMTEIECISDENQESNLWHLAASIMKKTDHPWRDEVTQKAVLRGGTSRAAFKVEQSDQGTKAKIQSAEVLLGSLAFLEENEVVCDQFLLEVKRKLKNGYEVLCVARNKVFLGLLVRHQEIVTNEFSESIRYFQQKNINVNILKNSLNMSQETLDEFGIETNWLGISKEEVLENIASLRQSGENVLMIGGSDHSKDDEFSLGVSIISIDKVKDLSRTMNYSQTVKTKVLQNFKLGKVWNSLGPVLAIPLAIAAPIVNLLSDAVILILLARSKRVSENIEAPSSSLKQVEKKTSKNKALAQPLRKESGIPWHATSNEAIIKNFEVDEVQGLTAEQLITHRNSYGLNKLEQKEQEPWLMSYLGQFKEFTTVILLGTALIAIATGAMFDGIAMGSILLVNAVIGTVQERKAERVIEALSQFQPSQCKVIREGKHLEILGSELLPGDIVQLEAGERVR